RMPRYVETHNLGVRQQLLELVEQVSLAATDVEDPGVALESVDIDQFLRGWRPVSLDEAIAAVAVAPVAVPIVGLVLLGLQHAMHLVVDHAREVVALGRAVHRGHDVEQSAHEAPRTTMGMWRQIAAQVKRGTSGRRLVGATAKRVKGDIIGKSR